MALIALAREWGMPVREFLERHTSEEITELFAEWDLRNGS